MTPSAIAQQRLLNQQISASRFKNPGELVTWLGAVQAQDYLGSLWAMGLRLANSTEDSIKQAINRRDIVRTWPMRGTLHFVASADVRWMCELMTPRVVRNNTHRERNLELNDRIYTQSRQLLTKSLHGGKQKTRNELCQLLEEAGISTKGQRGIHILWRLSQEGLLCFGSHQGKQPSFALLEEWVPAAKSLPRDAALAEITQRYFLGHGPATVQDMMWWSGLTAVDIKAGLDMVKSKLISETIDGKTYWFGHSTIVSEKTNPSVYILPPYDEFLLGYRDRSAALDRIHASKVVPGGNGIFLPLIVVNSQVVGTWKRTIKKNSVVISKYPFAQLNTKETQAFGIVAQRYADFLGLSLDLV